MRMTRMRDGAAPHARLGCTDEERVSSERPDVDGDVVPRRVVGELAMRRSDALVLLLHELALAAPRLRPQCPLSPTHKTACQTRPARERRARENAPDSEARMPLEKDT